jgi:Putative metallopeptidase
MKVASSVAVAVLALSPLLFVMEAAAQALPELSNPQIEIAYVPPRNSAFLAIQDRLKKRKVLEQLKQLLAPLKLPQKLAVQFAQCDAPSRPYRPSAPATICYELIDQIEHVAAKAQPNLRATVLAGTVVQAVLHEVAHGVFDILKVPIWGRTNDAADMLAAFIMLQFGEEVARQAIVGTAVFWELSNKAWSGSAFADQGSPEAQRYFNYLCIAYGGAPKTFEFLVKAEEGKNPILPAARAKHCKREYEQFRKAFDLRIMPYVEPDLLVMIRARPWLIVGSGK